MYGGKYKEKHKGIFLSKCLLFRSLAERNLQETTEVFFIFGSDQNSLKSFLRFVVMIDCDQNSFL